MTYIKFSDVHEAMLLGREIEFKLNENDYFLQPYYDDPHINDLNYPLKYVIYDLVEHYKRCPIVWIRVVGFFAFTNCGLCVKECSMFRFPSQPLLVESSHK